MLLDKSIIAVSEYFEECIAFRWDELYYSVDEANDVSEFCSAIYEGMTKKLEISFAQNYEDKKAVLRKKYSKLYVKVEEAINKIKRNIIETVKMICPNLQQEKMREIENAL